jgi:threonine aldolase
MKIIDLRSDTVTRPTPGMRAAMAAAEVGDDFYREDPTVGALEERAAALLDKPAAMLVLSGTMGNLVSLLAWAQRGDAILLGANSHIFQNESANPAAVAGLLPVPVDDPRGVHRPDQVTAALRPESVLAAPLSLVCLENTHNAGGGFCLSAPETDAICAVAHGAGLKVHVDGARIFNAAVGLGVAAATLVRSVDSVTFCLSKGLGCPVGSLVLGPRDFIARARRWRQMVGGGMRQAGVFAAAGLVALDTMIERLADDHANARRLAELLRGCGLAPVSRETPTNMVFVDVTPGPLVPDALVRALRAEGLVVNPPKGRRIRFVTHADVTAADIEEAGRRIARAVQAATRQAG